MITDYDVYIEGYGDLVETRSTRNYNIHVNRVFARRLYRIGRCQFDPDHKVQFKCWNRKYIKPDLEFLNYLGYPLHIATVGTALVRVQAKPHELAYQNDLKKYITRYEPQPIGHIMTGLIIAGLQVDFGYDILPGHTEPHQDSILQLHQSTYSRIKLNEQTFFPFALNIFAFPGVPQGPLSSLLYEPE